MDWAMLPVEGQQEEILNTKWHAQPKLDGHRMCAIGKGTADVVLVTKRGQRTTVSRPPGWRGGLAVGTTLDGELVAGSYYAFDILGYKGEDVSSQTHQRRMALLKKSVPIFDKHFGLGTYEDVGYLWKSVLMVDAEGLVLKDPRSPYIVGPSSYWKKIKNTKTRDAIVSEAVPNKAGHTVMLVDPGTDKNLGKVHTTKPVLIGGIVRVRYCQTYPDGRLREAVILET